MIKMYRGSADNGKITIIVMIDLSAAFDTVAVPIVLKILSEDFGFGVISLGWVESY